VIATTLVGGLGNQLFQYAAGRTLALRFGTDLLLDLSLLRGPQSALATPRRFELGCFDLDATTVDRVDSWEELRGSPGIRLRAASRLRRARACFTVLRQRGFDFEPAFFDAPDGTHLVGFWQSERYFVDHAEQVRRDLALPEPLPAAAPLLERVGHGLSVSLHVRRGDYVHDAVTRRVHGVLSDAYYRRALDRIAERAGADLDVYAFSDEPAHCREHFDIGVPFTTVDLGETPAYEELRVMSACRHHVVANSSFSWWGAWLDPRPDAIVVAPSRWVADPSIDTAHVVPDRWIRVDHAPG
jgi:Glycosyl transferase family 11